MPSGFFSLSQNGTEFAWGIGAQAHFGMFGGRFAALVIVPPQVAILGAGRIAPRAVVADGKLVAHRLLPLSLTFDHRAVTGGEAARFLKAAIEELERPE